MQKKCIDIANERENKGMLGVDNQKQTKVVAN